jgi:O-antigen ligase
MAEIRQKISHPISWWLTIYLITFFIASLFSMSKPLSLLGSYERHTGFITTALFTFFYFVAIVTLKLDDVLKALEILALTAIAVSLVAALQSQNIFLTDLEYIYNIFYRRVFGTLSHPVYLGIYLTMTIPLAAAMIPARSRSRLVCAIALPLMVFALVKTLSRGALIAVALSAFSFVYLFFKHMRRDKAIIESDRRGNWHFAGISLVLVVSGVALLFYFFPILQLRLATLFHFTEESRFEIYKSVFRLIKDHPLFGTGPDTFRVSFLPYKSLELARAFPMTNHDQAHNQFLHILATAGVFPFIAYVGLLASMVQTNLRTLKHPGSPARAGALGIACSTIGYIAAMMPAFDNMTTLLILHFLAGATVIMHKSVIPPAPRLVDTEKIPLRGPAHYAWSLTALVAGVAFIGFGSALWAAEHFAMAGNTAAKIDNKIAYFEQASRWMPYESYYSYNLGLHYKDRAAARQTAEEKNADFLHSATILENSIEHSWQPENSVFQLSRIFIELGAYKNTESLALKFLEFDHYNEGVRINLMVALSMQGRLNEALGFLERWITEFPGRDTYPWYAGLLYGELKDFVNAEKKMARAHELEPANASYKFELERVRRILKDMPEPVIPLLTNQNGQPIIALENISRELELELRPVVLSKNDGKPIITLENHTIDPIQMQDLLYRDTKGAKHKLFNMDIQD